MSNQPEFPPFDATGDPSTVGSRWTKWLARFNIYLLSKGITGEEKKLAVLLMRAGEHVHDIYDTLDHTRNAVDGVQESVFIQAGRVLSEHFNPKKNREYSIYLFRQAKQGDDESVHQFYLRLMGLAAHCEFHYKKAEIQFHPNPNATQKSVVPKHEPDD